jgi:hypothetical protein
MGWTPACAGERKGRDALRAGLRRGITHPPRLPPCFINRNRPRSHLPTLWAASISSGRNGTVGQGVNRSQSLPVVQICVAWEA